MDKDEELKLRVEIKKLEYKKQATNSAIRYGWIPFVAIGVLLMIVLSAAIGVGGSIFSDTSDIQLLLGLGFIVLIFGLIMFYSMAFFRKAKISAKLSHQQAVLEMETSGERDT